MKKYKFIAAATAAAVPISLALSGVNGSELLNAAAELTRRTAYIAAGVALPQTSAEAASEASVFDNPAETQSETPHGETAISEIEEQPEALLTTALPEAFSEPTEPVEQLSAEVISRNITEFDDGLDYSAEGTKSGSIIRRTYGKFSTAEYITLESGAQIRNCTKDSRESLLEAAETPPDIDIKLNTDEPQVLILHTHGTESFEPYSRDYYDADFPFRSRDSEHNMVAVGAALAESLAENGISVIHDGTLHDYPSYTGAYDRSEATIRNILSEYPSIKLIIDLHRDAITDTNGNRIAPTATVDGKSAAQLMIICGGDDGRFNMPNYIENFRLAALLQSTSEEMYPSLARAVLFDYVNYNQHISTGSLLIEVGTHANSLDEALYTAELLGNVIAETINKL